MSSQPMGEDANIERIDENPGNVEGDMDIDSIASSKKRFSAVYNYFTFDETTSRWRCNYCE
jgi:hypothetical protein